MTEDTKNKFDIEKVINKILSTFLDMRHKDQIVANDKKESFTIDGILRKRFPYNLFFKSDNRFNVSSEIKKAEKNADFQELPTALLFEKDDNVYVTIRFDEFLKLLHIKWKRRA